MKKKTICLLTNWYPSKDNPYRGSFFKEQSFEMEMSYDFIIIHYHERKGLFKQINVDTINSEKNTKEYDISINVPYYLYFLNEVIDFYTKHTHKMTEGVGKYSSNRYQKAIRNIFSYIYKKYFYDLFDVIYCVDAQTEAFYIECLSKASGKPYVVGEHAPFPWPGSVIKDYQKAAIENSNLFLAISNDKIRQLLLQNVQLPKVEYVGNMIDDNVLTINESKRDIKTFLIVASHSYYKNYDMFIRVMNKLCSIANHDFKVMIVGYAANKGYSKNVQILEKKIKDSLFSEKAILIPEVKHEEIVKIYHRADAFVMTSIQEGQPVSALEAACCGLPIFSTRCGGVEDYVDDKIGRLFDLLDVDNFAYSLNDYLDNKISFNSEYIRNKVVSIYGKQKFVNRMINIFDEVCE